MSISEDIDKKKVRNIGAILLIVALMAGVGFVIDRGEPATESEPEFQIEFSEDSIDVLQTQGDTVDSVDLRVQYLGNESETVTLDSPSGTIFSFTLPRPVGDVSEASVVYDNQIQVTETPPDDLQPQPLSASDSLNTSEYSTGEEVNLSADDLIQSDVTITSYEWNMGDGTSYQESNITHTYDESGEYTIRLNATDIRGKNITQEYTITVGDSETSLIMDTNRIPPSVSTGQEIAINASEFTADSVDTYEWNMGDGTEYNTTSITHAYQTRGSFEIMLTAISGEREETQTYNIAVGGNGSGVSIMPSIRVIEQNDLSVTLSADESEPESDIESYNWDFGDGETATRSITEVQHEYAEPGTYVVTLEVRSGGQTETTQTSVTVDNATDGTNGGDNQDGENTGDDGSGDGSSGDGSNDGSDDGSGGDDSSGDDSNDNGSNGGSSGDDSTDSTDQTDSEVTVQFNSTEDGYTVESVTPSRVEDQLLSTDETGDANPILFLEEGTRYTFKLGDVAYDNPIQFRDDNGSVLLSMTSVGELEMSDSINWLEQGTEVRFTATQELINRSDRYVSVNNTDYSGEIRQYEEVEPAEQRENDVVIEIDNNGVDHWRVVGVSGSESYSDVVPDGERSTPNPTIHMTEGLRYRFVGIPDGPSEEDLSLSFLNLVGTDILSQEDTGTFEDDPQVGWVDEGNAVEFTITSDISDEFERYYAPERNEAMKGSVIID